MIKKAICISLAIFLSTGLLACGQKSSETQTTDSSITAKTTDAIATAPAADNATSSTETSTSATPTVISSFDLGTTDTKTNTYQNKEAGLSVQLPESWVTTDAENLQKATTETFGSDSLYKFLLMAYDENGADELTTAHLDIRIAEKSGDEPISTTLESQRELYLAAVEKGLTGITVGDVEERTINNQTVYYLRIKTADPIVQEFIAFDKDGIAVQLYYYWSTEADGQKAQTSIDSIQIN